MTIKNARITYLYKQFLNDTATPEEVEEFMKLLETSGRENQLESESESLYNSIEAKLTNSQAWKHILDKANDFSEDNLDAKKPNSKNTRRRRYLFGSAAIVLILMGITSLFLTSHSNDEKLNTQTAKIVKDVDPGGNKAILTLSNGSKIQLDSTAGTGLLALQSGAKVVKEANGQIRYQNDNKSTNVIYNTLTIPRGGQYKLILSDGSKVWLNAASSIHYPTAFNTPERRVEITGEAYFEIAHDPHKPFIVSTGNTEVRVLGTHFNVNAYNDEDKIRTTLLQGRVKISTNTASKKSSQILVPGQQATVDAHSGVLSVKKVDLNEAIAWVNGNLSLKNLDVRELMKQVSRWYNVDIIYKAEPSPGRFGGVIKRDVKLSTVINVMKECGINASLENGKVIIR